MNDSIQNQMSRNLQECANYELFEEDLELKHNFSALKFDLIQFDRVSLVSQNLII